jgi:type I restriction enzyme S subunit
MRETIGDLFSIVKGHKAPLVFNRPRSGTFRYIQIEDLRPYSERRYVKDDNGVFASTEDILIAWDGANAGTVGWGLEGYAGSTIAILRPIPDKAYTPFFGYFLYSKFHELQANTSGATIPHVNRGYLERLELEIPPLPEQKRIAGILERVDRLRRLRRYACELSDTYLQSVFMEMFGEYLDHDVSSIFADVLNMPLQNGVFENKDRYGSGIPVIWVDNLYHTISIETDDLRKAELNEKTISKYEVLEDDLLFTRSSLVREGVGQINIVPKLMDRTTFECHIIRARVDKNIVEPHYILGLYRSYFGKNAILRRSNTATMTTIGQESLKELPCPIPPLPLQKQFTKIVQKFERLQSQQREAERQAEHLFQTLLHRAFKGELS